MNTQNTTSMRLVNLKPHPLQSTFYGDCSETDDVTLAADLRQRGQQSPIIVMPTGNAASLPPGTILDGHRRARLMRANGETHAIVVVRDDLKDASTSAVEAEFLKYNFTRRQLHPIDKARVAQRLYLLERNKKPLNALGPKENLGMRDRVGKILNMSGRNLDRYLRVLETPIPIQNAVRDGRLKLVLGAKIGILPKYEQQRIADAIKGVIDPNRLTEIVGRHIGVPDNRRHQKPNDAANSFATALERGLEDMRDRIDKIGTTVVRRRIDTFRQARDVISTLIAKVDPDTDAVSRANVNEVRTE
jgi:hypothetical protein